MPTLTFDKIKPLLSGNLLAGWAAAHRPLEVLSLTRLATNRVFSDTLWILRMACQIDALHLGETGSCV